MIEPESREPGCSSTVDAEQPAAGRQLEKWEPRRTAEAPGGHVALANSVEDESQASGSSLASSGSVSDSEAEEMVECATGPSPEAGRPYLAALEVLGSQLSNGPEANSVNIGNNIIKDTNTVHVGPRIVNKFMGTIQIENLTYANPAADLDRIEKHAEAEASEPRPKLSTTSDHPLFPLSQARVAEWLWTRKCIVSIIVAAVLLIVIVVVAVVLTQGRLKSEPDNPSSPNDSSITTGNFSHLVKRSEWTKVDPKAVASPLEKLPPEYVIILHTATAFCKKKSACTQNVQNIQSYHMVTLGWNDIGYNFLVGGDGYVYEGRGWDVEAAHTPGYNGRSIGIAFIGDFETRDQPTPKQLNVAKRFLEFGVAEKKLDENYIVYGQRQVLPRISPGKNLQEAIQSWEHWKEVKDPAEKVV